MYRLKSFQRRMRPMRGFKWRGFSVELYNNGYSFRYEWKLRPLGATSLRLTKYRGQFRKVLHDPTSMLRLASAKEGAKMRTNEMRCPFWMARRYRF